MKKNSYIILALVLLTSCKNEKSKIESVVRDYVQLQIGKESKIDELKILSFDTATEKTKYTLRAEQLSTKANEIAPQLNIYKQAVASRVEMYRDYPSEQTKGYVDRSQKELADYYAKDVQPIIDEMNELDAKVKVSDSTTFLAYYPTAFLRYTTKDNIQKVDTIAVLVTKDYKIIEKHDFLK